MRNAIESWIAQTDPAHFWIVATVGLAVGASLLVVGYFRFKRLQLIANTPTSRIRSAAQGYLELAGTARGLGGAPIVAPLTLTPCTWFAYRVKERHGGDGERTWRVVDSGRSDGLFALDDDTGRCVIDPDGASVVPSQRETWYGSERYPSRGRKHQRIGFGQRYKFEEERIVDGDPLFALGEFKTLRAGDPQSTREEVSMLLREWKQDRAELIKAI